MHFFNPALVMRCVEVVGGPQTSTATVDDRPSSSRAGSARSRSCCAREIPGFVANRILSAVRDEAIFLLEEGVASVEAIDTACRTALGYPMGPFELMDLTGIDIGYHAKLARHAAAATHATYPAAPSPRSSSAASWDARPARASTPTTTRAGGTAGRTTRRDT